jgi:hypothetical protein
MRMFQQLRKFVLALSGVHEETLRLVPTQRARFESLGWAVLITSCMAAISMWFALASAVGINGILALPVALFWGLVIMGIDRWLITSMPVGGGRKLAMALPRLALAVLLGTLISTPLVLRVFQSEINAQIAVMQQNNYTNFLKNQQASQVTSQVTTYYNELQQVNKEISTHGAATGNNSADPQLVTYGKQLTNLNTELAHWTALKNQYYTAYVCQLYGGPTCPKKGNGPAAKASHANYVQASNEVNTLEGQINQVQGEIQQRDSQLNSSSKASQQARYQQALTQLPIVQAEYNTALQRKNELQAGFFASNQASHGILIRLEALSQLSNGNPTVTGARLLLFLLFLVIECLPVTVKLLQPAGLYEEALGETEKAHRRNLKRAYSGRPWPDGSGFPAGQPAVLHLRPEPERSIDSIWNSTRVLTRAPGDSDPDLDLDPEAGDDQPTEAFRSHLPAQAAGRHDWVGEYPPPGPGLGRPKQWRGAEQWRNHWRDQADQDDQEEPSVQGASGVQDAPMVAGASVPATRVDVPAADPLVAQTRMDHQYPGDEAWSSLDEHATMGGGAEPVQAESAPARSGQTRSDDTGGWTPLSWDEDE